MIRGLVGIGLALLALVPLGCGVLLLTRTPGRFGLGVFTGVAAAMVLLPPLYYVGVSPSIPVVLALGIVALALGLAFGRRDVIRTRVEWLPLAVLAVPLVLLAARGAEKPVDTYDAFAVEELRLQRPVRELDAEGEAPLLRARLLRHDDCAAGPS